MKFLATLKASTAKLTPFFIYTLLTSTLGTLLFGYHLAELNAPQEVITCAKDGIRAANKFTVSALPQCIPMTPLSLGLVSSIYTLGGLLGALLAGPLSARSGRLRPMRYMTFISLLGATLEALSPSIPILALGRFVSGIAAGASTVIVPLYISEIAPPRQKGFFGAFTQISTNTGIFISQLLGYFLSYGSKWRWILAAAGIVAVVQFVLLVGSVESPQWSAENDGSESGGLRKARSDLERIRGSKVDLKEEVDSWSAGPSTATTRAGSLIPATDGIEEEEALLGSSSTPTYAEGGAKNIPPISMLTALTDSRYTKSTLAVILVMLAQQLTGINSIIMYGVSLLSTLLSSSSALLNIFVSILNIVITTTCAPLSDVIGRKPCLLLSITGMGLSSVLLAIGISASASILSAVAVLFFVASFGVGLGPVPFILASELVGPEAVGATQSWALSANWISTFVVAQFFPVLNEKLEGGGAYWVFAGMAGVFLVGVGWFVPETRGRMSGGGSAGAEGGNGGVGRSEREE
jgi:MFS family permease